MVTVDQKRLAFHESMNRALKQAQRHQRMLALLLIHLKTDDAALFTEAGKQFAQVLRATDILAATQDQEYAILMTDLDHPKNIGTVADKLLKLCEFTFNLLPCRIGIAVFPDDGQTLEDLQTQAAAALFQAQQQSGHQYQFARSQLTLEAHDFTQMQAELQHALKRQEFVLYYQTKMNPKSRQIVGVEALLRWRHPRLGLVDPMTFVPSAEETGLMLKIGAWALKQACLDNKFWQDQGYQPISMAVNLTPKQLFHPEMLNTVKAILDETELDPGYLELEITEMTILDDTDKVRPLLQAFRDLGLSLAIDDFGTGHTALSYLKNLPISTLKIDQSFIKSLPEDAQNVAITQALITLAHQLHCQVVAEGVETAEQLQLLADQGCDLVQGYFISRPLPAELLLAQL